MTTHDEHDPAERATSRGGPEGHAGGDDPALGRVIADLDRLYAGATQPPHQRAAVDRAIYGRLALLGRSDGRAARVHAHLHAALPRSIPRGPRGARGRRRVILACALLAVVLGAGIVYAAGSLVDQTFPPAALPYSHNVSLSQGACGFTMTVTRAYLDGSRAIVGYTMSGPPGRTFVAEGPLPFELPDEYLNLRTMGDAPINLMLLQALGDDVVGTTQAQTLQFDAGPVVRTAGLTGAIPLRLDVPYIAMTEQLTGRAWATSPCETYRPDIYPAQLKRSARPTRVVAVKGPFAFDLRVAPLVSPREADPHQVAQASGERVELDRVVVTPADTRVYLWREAGRSRYAEQPRLTVALGADPTPTTDDPFSRAASATYSGTLIPDPIAEAREATAVVTSPRHTYSEAARDPAGLVEYDFLRAPSLYGYHGPWTLVVPTRGGPVTFRFTVGDAPLGSPTPPDATLPSPSVTTGPNLAAIGTPTSAPTVGPIQTSGARLGH